MAGGWDFKVPSNPGQSRIFQFCAGCEEILHVRESLWPGPHSHSTTPRMVLFKDTTERSSPSLAAQCLHSKWYFYRHQSCCTSVTSAVSLTQVLGVPREKGCTCGTPSLGCAAQAAPSRGTSLLLLPHTALLATLLQSRGCRTQSMEYCLSSRPHSD